MTDFGTHGNVAYARTASLAPGTLPAGSRIAFAELFKTLLLGQAAAAAAPLAIALALHALLAPVHGEPAAMLAGLIIGMLAAFALGLLISQTPPVVRLAWAVRPRSRAGPLPQDLAAAQSPGGIIVLGSVEADETPGNAERAIPPPAGWWRLAGLMALAAGACLAAALAAALLWTDALATALVVHLPVRAENPLLFAPVPILLLGAALGALCALPAGMVSGALAKAQLDPETAAGTVAFGLANWAAGALIAILLAAALLESLSDPLLLGLAGAGALITLGVRILRGTPPGDDRALRLRLANLPLPLRPPAGDRMAFALVTLFDACGIGLMACGLLHVCHACFLPGRAGYSVATAELAGTVLAAGWLAGAAAAALAHGRQVSWSRRLVPDVLLASAVHAALGAAAGAMLLLGFVTEIASIAGPHPLHLVLLTMAGTLAGLGAGFCLSRMISAGKLMYGAIGLVTLGPAALRLLLIAVGIAAGALWLESGLQPPAGLPRGLLAVCVLPVLAGVFAGCILRWNALAAAAAAAAAGITALLMLLGPGMWLTNASLLHRPGVRERLGSAVRVAAESAGGIAPGDLLLAGCRLHNQPAELIQTRVDLLTQLYNAQRVAVLNGGPSAADPGPRVFRGTAMDAAASRLAAGAGSPSAWDPQAGDALLVFGRGDIAELDRRWWTRRGIRRFLTTAGPWLQRGSTAFEIPLGSLREAAFADLLERFAAAARSLPGARCELILASDQEQPFAVVVIVWGQPGAAGASAESVAAFRAHAPLYMASVPDVLAALGRPADGQSGSDWPPIASSGLRPDLPAGQWSFSMHKSLVGLAGVGWVRLPELPRARPVWEQLGSGELDTSPRP